MLLALKMEEGMEPSLEAVQGKEIDSSLKPPERNAALPTSSFTPSETNSGLLNSKTMR